MNESIELSSNSELDAVSKSLTRLRERIAHAGGDPEQVTIVAVTKGFGAEVARLALDASLIDLGENYAQELVAKAAALDKQPGGVSGASSPHWHLLGRLQTNKVRHLAPLVKLWQSVDRLGVILEIARRSPGAEILIQANLSGEDQKGGCSFDEVPDLVARARDVGLDVTGLMGVGPAGPPSGARPGFERLVGLADELALPVRSIGMSSDLEVAVRAGSTMVRVGTDLFGARSVRGQDHTSGNGPARTLRPDPRVCINGIGGDR